MNTVLKNQARISGLLYLLLGVTGIFGIMVIPSKIIVNGDAVATATNIQQHEILYGLGIISSLACQVLFIYLVLSLYQLLKGVNKRQAILMVSFVLVAVPIAFVVEIIHLAPVILLKKSEMLAQFQVDQLNAMAMFFLEFYYKAMSVTEILWGFWLLPFGVLVYQSRFIPKIFGILLMIAFVGYLVNSFASIVYPVALSTVSSITSITGTIGEFSIIFWLLIKGVRNSENMNPVSAA